MPRSQKVTGLLVILVALSSAIYTVVSNNKPLLGLDLQGGVSVVLQPTGQASDEGLNQSVEIIRSRVDALGVAEPEISRQGNTIVVDLPGIKEQNRALALVGQTAELRFRPVLADLGSLAALNDATQNPATQTSPTDQGGSSSTTAITAGGADTTAPAAGGATTATTAAGSSSSQQGLGPIGYSGRFGAAAPLQSSTTASGSATTATTAASSATTAPGGATTATTAVGGASTTAPAANGTATTAAGDTTATTAPSATSTLNPAQLAAIQACSSGNVTKPEDDKADLPVLLTDERQNLVCLGPSLLTGDALETAGATIDQTGRWVVNPVFKAGAGGIDAFNAAAAKCYAQSPDPNLCPTGRLAIVLDHKVVSSPSINAATFTRDQIVISGSFTKESAQDLASVLRFGALPVELKTQQVQTVSATIGSDALHAGVIAGLIGLALVAVYLLAYYRLAALVTIFGLGLSATMLWSVISYFGAKMGLALTLGGVVGLIVSIGVSADSSIVYFENVKEAYQSGRKLSTSVERAYQGAMSTVIKADFVSLIAAALLYWLTVGAVRGFAFYLGLATIFDLINSWLFMRPALTFLARRQGMAERPGALLGVHTEVVPA